MFWLPFGGERLNKTTYAPLANVVATFASAQTSLNAHLGGGSVDEAEPPQADAPSVRSRGDSKGRRPGAGRRPAARVPSQGPHPVHPESPDKRPDVSSPIEGVPQPAAAASREAPIEFTPDLIRDAFEGEPSKFPLDAKAANDGVLLRLEGLCRWRGHYIIKVAVGNRNSADFFVKELSAYAGGEVATTKSYFRLLVEPGRTREGYVLFDARSGAQVKVVLKEDREGGRALEVPVRYPF